MAARTHTLLNVCSVLALATSLAGCASMVNNGNQTSKLIVKGSESAYCEFKNNEYINKVGFQETGSVNLERSARPLLAECWGDEGRYTKMRLTPALTKETALNTSTGILPGLGYDMFAGGMWRWPDPIIVDFRAIETDPATPAVAWPDSKLADARDEQATATTELLAESALNPAQSILPYDAAPLPPADAVKYISSIGRLPVEATAPQTTTNSLVATPASKGRMQPIASPEDFEKPDPKPVKKTKPKPKIKKVAETTPSTTAEQTLPETTAAAVTSTQTTLETPKPVEPKPEAVAEKPATETPAQTTTTPSTKTSSSAPAEPKIETIMAQPSSAGIVAEPSTSSVVTTTTAVTSTTTTTTAETPPAAPAPTAPVKANIPSVTPPGTPPAAKTEAEQGSTLLQLNDGTTPTGANDVPENLRL